MFRKLIVTLVLLGPVVATPLAAQDAPRRPAFGLVGGGNLASLGGGDIENAKFNAGLTLGAFARFPITTQWAFQPELEWVQKGVKSSESVNDIAVKSTLALSYLELPLLMRVSALESPRGRLYAEFGPAVSFNLTCFISASNGAQSFSEGCAESDPDIKRMDYSAVAGAGYEFTMGARALSLGVRYTYGFPKLWPEIDVRNRNLQVLAGWRF